MKNIIICSILLFLSLDIAAQNYYRIDILKKADSLMIAHLGQDLFDKYYEHPNNVEYHYKTRKNAKNIKSATLKTDTEPTKKYLSRIIIPYRATNKGKDISNGYSMYVCLFR